MMIFSIPAIILNIGADIAGMAAVSHMIVPSVKPIYFSVGFTMILLWLIVYLPYDKIVSVLKYLCLSILLYIAVPFFVPPQVLPFRGMSVRRLAPANAMQHRPRPYST